MSITTKTYKAIREEVESTPPGGKLPTVRELMDRLGATQFAVQSALKALKEEGIISTQVGRGSFVSDNKTSANKKDSSGYQNLNVLLMTHSMRSGRGDRVAAAIYEDLMTAGHSVLAVTYNDLSSIESVLVNNSFDLCLLQPRKSVLPVSVLASLKKCAKHIIIEGRSLEKMDVDVIYRDRFESIKLACHHLRELGHHSIGLISESQPEKVGYRDVELAFNLYCEAAGIEHAPIIKSEICQDLDAQECTQALVNKLSEYHQEQGTLPTAFVVSGHFSGQNILQAFQSIGLAIPEEVSVVRIRASGDLDVPGGFFTSVARAPDQIAKSIHTMIDKRLAAPTSAPMVFRDKPVLNLNKSSRSVKINNNH